LWQPFVDAEPVRLHLRNLQACSMGLRAVAAAAHVDRKRLQAVLNGRPERGTPPQNHIRPELAAAVLQVEATLDTMAPSTVINAAGTRRRLQALVFAGWPQAHLASALGMSPGNFSTLVKTDRVIVRTARAVRDLYDRFWRADPLRAGVPSGSVTRAKNLATAHRWAPVGAWDDDTIDDPAALPNIGAKTLRMDAVAEDTTFLINTLGMTREQAATRLGVTRDTVDASLSRVRRRDAA
jgi:plasmid maintenance system antidote protein VapI